MFLDRPSGSVASVPDPLEHGLRLFLARHQTVLEKLEVDEFRPGSPSSSRPENAKPLGLQKIYYSQGHLRACWV